MNLCPKNVPKWMQEEYVYIYTERIGMMCEDGIPTPEQERIADNASEDFDTDAFHALNLSRTMNPYTALSADKERLLIRIAEAIARAQAVRSHIATGRGG